MRTRTIALLFVAILYLLHQDFWNWTAARPLLFGFLPPGLWYHGLYTLALVVFFAWLVKKDWPAEEDPRS